MCCDEDQSHKLRVDVYGSRLQSQYVDAVTCLYLHQTFSKPLTNSTAEDSAMTCLLLSRSPCWSLIGSFHLLHLQQCSHHSSCTALCIHIMSICRAALRVKVHVRRGRVGVAIQQAWVLLQDLHQLSAVQGGRLGRARARRMESLMKVCAPLAVMPHLLHVLQPGGV